MHSGTSISQTCTYVVWKGGETTQEAEDRDLLQTFKVKKLSINQAPNQNPRYLSKKNKAEQQVSLANKGPYGQSYGFLVVTYGCESWIIKKAEHRRSDALNCGAGEDS